MPQKLNQYVLVVIGMGVSFIISSFLLQTLFLDKNPTPNWNSFSNQIAQVKQNALLAESSIANQIQQIANSIQSSKPTPLPIQSPHPIEPSVIPPTQQAIPPTSLPTQYIKLTPYPTMIIVTPIRTKPTAIPTNKPLPTSPPPTSIPEPTIKPTIAISFPKVVGDPLKQPWYGNRSLACYGPDRFIKVYAGGLTPTACLANIQKTVEANLTTVILLGTRITVHKKAAEAFKAVADTLDQYKGAAGTYNFPSKAYKIKNVGAYNFRCNTNAGDSQEICKSGCVISPHAFGIAVDINYDENCNGCKKYDMPEEIWKTFELYGFRWGGHYPLIGSYIDPMHFEYMKDLCEGV